MSLPESPQNVSSSIPQTVQPQGNSSANIPPAAPVPAKKNQLWMILIILLVLAVLLSVGVAYMFYTGYSEQNKTEAQAVQTPLPSNKLVIGTDATFPPMEYIDDRGEFAGYDIEVGQKIAEVLGTQAEFKNISWTKLFNGLLDKKVDMIMSSVSITDERKKLYAFSEPYFNAGQVIITLKSNTTIQVPQDLKGKKVAVTPGTTNEIEAKKYTSLENVIGYESNEEAVAALKTGTISAMIQDLSGAKGIVNLHPELKIAGDPFTIENYGIVLRKEDVARLRKINAALLQLREKGVLDDIKQKWFD